MVQAGGGAGLVLEALQALGIHRPGEGQDLERDASAKADLLAFIDDPHAAATDFAQDAEIAQDAVGQTLLFTGAFGRRPRLPHGRQAEHLQRGQHFAEDGSSLRITAGILLHVGFLAAPLPLQKLVGHLGHQGLQRGASNFCPRPCGERGRG